MGKLSKEEIVKRLKGLSEEERKDFLEALKESGLLPSGSGGDLEQTILSLQADVKGLKEAFEKIGKPAPNKRKDIFSYVFGED